jgi:hypothetical protein
MRGIVFQSPDQLNADLEQFGATARGCPGFS